MSVPVLVFARVAIGAAVLLPLAIRRGQIRVLACLWRWLALFAVVEIMLPWALLSDAERRLSSSLTGLLIAVVPIIGLVLARLTGGPEQLTAVRWAGLLAGLGGVALLAGPHLAGGGAWPIAEVMLVALCYATGPLIANRKLGDLPGLGMTAVCLAAAALVYAAPAALTWPSRLPSAAVLGSLAGLGVLCTALAFVLFFKLIAEAGPARATVITYVNPAVAVALGVSRARRAAHPGDRGRVRADLVRLGAGDQVRPARPAPGPRLPAPDRLGLPRTCPPRQLRPADRPALPD